MRKRLHFFLQGTHADSERHTRAKSETLCADLQRYVVKTGGLQAETKSLPINQD